MKAGGRSGSRGWAPIVLLLGMVAMLVLSWDERGAQPVEAAGSTPDMAMSIDVGGGGDDCDTRASTVNGSTCEVAVGSMFTVKGHVDSYTGISGTGGFGGINFHFDHSAGLTLKNRSLQTELGPAGSPYWADCAARSETKPAGGYEAVCHTSGASSLPMVPLKVVEVDYNCATAGSRTITMVDATTFLYNSGHAVDNSDKEGDEVLTIICSASVGGIAGLPEVAGMPLAAPDSSGTNIGLLAGVAAAAAAGVVTMSGAAWYARKRWLR